ncbi:hypothetical protein Tsubulata_045908 [Turnera subulata]|uniref:Anaphase-promoting complex subunit 11 n=1 Tax=Turnera subulata TaxID=218843 RepID=A0A9Q0J1Q3_9ROSI|nr:hypothetical protein Tsubulata_045908 [Turnera subulata]
MLDTEKIIARVTGKRPDTLSLHRDHLQCVSPPLIARWWLYEHDPISFGSSKWVLVRNVFEEGVKGTSLVEDLMCGWHAVASWTWDAQDETCGICRMAFDGCCPDCKLPGDDCPLIWGACNHAFHLHCILKWVNSQTSQAHCPMCRREWQFKG